MASLFPEYEYDIFISYRQKDNKLDGWVTQLVSHLKDEIDATFKEDISIYFDENPHDGLLETHDVDLSLRDKVKAILFIPIISQTYCDPNSFAWTNEFIAFRDFAEKDEIGMNIELPNGNVVKRIVPIRIHKIDPSDLELYEKEVGGKMRSIDFIYKTSGVNRPLRPFEEQPENNLEKTIYRDQVNKVANSIKEIISSLKEPSEKESIPTASLRAEAKHKSKVKVIWPVLLAAILAVIIVITKPWTYINSDNVVRLENKSIAILPFKDLSPEQDKEYLGEGIASEIIHSFETIEGFKVIGQTSSFSFQDKQYDLVTIGETLDVKYILEGTVQAEGNTIRVGAQLIDAEDGLSIWTYKEDKELTSLLAIQSEIAVDLAELFDKTINNPYIEELSPEVQDQYYLARYYGTGVRGYPRENVIKSIDLFEEVISAEPDFSKAYSGLAYLYAIRGYFGSTYFEQPWEKAEEYAQKAIELDSSNAEAYMVQAYKARNFWQWERSRSLYKKAIRLNNNSSLINYQYALFLACINQADSGLVYAKKSFNLDPLDEEVRLVLMRLFQYARRYDEALAFIDRNISDKEAKDEMRLPFLLRNQNYYEYIEMLKKISASDQNNMPFEVYEESGWEAFERARYEELPNKESNLAWLGYSGHMDAAFSMLNFFVEDKRGFMVYLHVNPIFDDFRDDPRFDDLLKKMDLYEYKN